MADRVKYDLLPEAHKLTMPVLVVIGENDDLLPHQQLLLDKLSGPHEFHVIAGAGHTFRSVEECAELSRHLSAWLEKYSQ